MGGEICGVWRDVSARLCLKTERKGDREFLGVCYLGVMLAIFSLVYCFCTRRSKIPAQGVCKTIIILADLLLMYLLLYTASQICGVA